MATECSHFSSETMRNMQVALEVGWSSLPPHRKCNRTRRCWPRASLTQQKRESAALRDCSCLRWCLLLTL